MKQSFPNVVGHNKGLPETSAAAVMKLSKSYLRIPILFLAVTLTVAALAPATALADSNLILGGTAYLESGRMEGEESISVQDNDQSFDYKNSNFFSGRLIYLRPFTEKLYLGAGVDFIGTYRGTMIDEDEDEDSDEPPEYFEFGPLFELMAVGEYRFPLGEDYGLAVGGQAGLATLFPRGELAEEIHELKEQEVGVWNTPRLGIGAGAHVGFFFKIDERMSVRTEVGLQWQKLLLFRTTDTLDDVAYSKQWSTGTIRRRVGLSLQIEL